jgi:hypothetical protein
MATNAEIFALRNDQALLSKVAVAVAKACLTVFEEALNTPNHTARLTWARSAIADPLREAEKVIWLLLADNAGATVAQINAAADATIDSLVAGLVNPLANVAA